MDKDSIEKVLEREDVLEAIDLAIYTRGDPKNRNIVVLSLRGFVGR